MLSLLLLQAALAQGDPAPAVPAPPPPVQELRDPELAAFLESCGEAILPNLAVLPEILQAHPDLVVRIQISVNPDGTLSDSTIYEGSGDASFDRSVLLAVRKTSRVPAPPPDWANDAQKGGIILMFRAADLISPPPPPADAGAR